MRRYHWEGENVRNGGHYRGLWHSGPRDERHCMHLDSRWACRIWVYFLERFKAYKTRPQQIETLGFYSDPWDLGWYSEDGEGNGLGLGWVRSKNPIYLGGISSSNLFLARAFTFFTLHSVRCPGKDRADQRDYMPWRESILTTFYGLHRVDFCLLPKVKWKRLT